MTDQKLGAIAMHLEPTSPYGQRSMNAAIQARAATAPHGTFARIVCSFAPFEVKVVTFSHLLNAISKAAWLIQSCVPHEEPRGQTLWYSGVSDLRYLVFILAASRTGHKTVLISPKNTPEAHLRLLSATSCQHVFTSDENAEMVDLFVKAKLHVHEFPRLETIIWSEQAIPYPSELDFDVIADQPCFILHTSASTNHPKPITWTHRGIAVMESFHDLPGIDGEKALALEHYPHNNMFLGFPLFHAAGMNQMAYCVYHDSIPVFGPSSQPLSISLLEQMLQTGLLTSAALPPSIIEEAAQDPVLVAKFSQLDYIITGGAPLAEDVGNILCNVTRIMDLVGSTECNCYPELRLSKRPRDWAYHNFHPSLGIQFRHCLDDMYEAVFIRTKEHERFQAAFVTFPEMDEYSTNDLYSKHPIHPGLWRYRGRKDNVIVLSNGEKFQPDEVEAILNQQPEIQNALFVGEGRFQPAVLIVPTDGWGNEFKKTRIDSLVQLVNTHLPAHAHLTPSHVGILDRNVDVPRSLKGKVQRSRAVAALTTQIDNLYRQAESAAGSTPLDLRDRQSLESSIHGILQTLEPRFKDMPFDANLFSNGMNSLHATRFWRNLERELTRCVDIHREQFSSRLIYENPSICQLATAIKDLSCGKRIEQKQMTATEEMRDKIRESTALFPTTTTKRSSKNRKSKNILLTGSTGSLGCQVLHTLMVDPEVGTIHCLNRGTDSASRQFNMHYERGLRHDFALCNVKFHTADLAKIDFGLARDNGDLYSTLVKTIDCIIHLAWNVNWNEPLSSFAPHLKGCCNLVHFSSVSSSRPRIIFASSVGVAINISSGTNVVYEKPMHNLEAAEPTGYSRSKLVAEHILQQASVSPLCIPVTICRIGQIAGSTRGEGWSNSQEWFPSMIAASSRMGALPRSLGPMNTVDWIPIDVAAKCMTEVANGHDIDQSTVSTTVLKILQKLRKDTEKSATYVNLVNPVGTNWSENLIPAALRAMGHSTRVVSLQEWVSCLESRAQEDKSMEESSAGRLLDFYKRLSQRNDSLPAFETPRARYICPSMQGLSAIQPEWLESWISNWENVSSLDNSIVTLSESKEMEEKNPKHENTLDLPESSKCMIKVHGSANTRSYINLRAMVYSLAQRLLEKAEPVNACVDRLRFEPACSSGIRIAIDAGWLEQLSIKKTLSAEDIIKPGQSLELLVRTFRILSSARLIIEVGTHRYKANRRTLILCEEGVQAGLKHWFDNMAPTFCQLPTYFAANGYTEPTSQESGPYSHTFDSQTYWQRLEADPKQHETFNRYMQEHKKMGSSLAAIFPMSQLTKGFDKSRNDTLLVDVGGGKGHHLLEIAAKHPDLPGRLVLEDLPQTLRLTGSADAELLQAAHITLIAHNFFQPQPILGARYYYFSAIFHDWPDSHCQTIIKHTAKAMIPGYSKLLINGIILPERGASYFQAAKDWGMMAAMSGKERTLKQMEELVACVHGLNVTHVWYGPRGRDSVLECELVG